MGNNPVAVVIPARNEAARIGLVLDKVVPLIERGVIAEVIVVNDGSDDATPEIAESFLGVQVVTSASQGKGNAISLGVRASASSIIVTLDADLENLGDNLVARLAGELDGVAARRLVKACYHDPEVLGGNGGGRVTELVAKPLLERFFPEVSGLGSPLAGEAAFYRRDFLEVEVEPGYGFDIGLVIDFVQRWGTECLGEVLLGGKMHRHQALGPLSMQAREVMDAIFERANIFVNETDLGQETAL